MMILFVCYLQCVCNELCFCELIVLWVECISVGFQWIVFGGEVLDGFIFLGFDDYMKVFFFESGCCFMFLIVIEEGIIWGEGVCLVFRDYMLLYDEVCCELVLDFFIYDGGVVSCWVMEVCEGDILMIGGLCGLLVVLEDYVCQVYVCDEFGMFVLCCCLELFSCLFVCFVVIVLVSIQDVVYCDYFVYLMDIIVEYVVDGDEQVM